MVAAYSFTLLALLGATFWGCREPAKVEPTEVAPTATVGIVLPAPPEPSEVSPTAAVPAAPSGTLEPTKVAPTAAAAAQPPATLISRVPLPTTSFAPREPSVRELTATPEPPAPSTQATNGPSIHRRDTYDYQKIDNGLKYEVELFETHPEPGPSVDISETLAYFPVRVSIDIAGDSAATVQWLEANDVVLARGA